MSETLQQALDFAKAQAKAYENGYKAGMTRAAEICDKMMDSRVPGMAASNTCSYCRDEILKARDGE